MRCFCTDPESLLYKQPATQFIDITHEPLIREVSTHDRPSSGKDSPYIPTYALVLAIVIPIAFCAVVGVYAFINRRRVSEWLLWRLAQMRFTPLRDNVEMHEFGTLNVEVSGGDSWLTPTTDMTDAEFDLRDDSASQHSDDPII